MRVTSIDTDGSRVHLAYIQLGLVDRELFRLCRTAITPALYSAMDGELRDVQLRAWHSIHGKRE